jgi:hypothetical protein
MSAMPPKLNEISVRGINSILGRVAKYNRMEATHPVEMQQSQIVLVCKRDSKPIW